MKFLRNFLDKVEPHFDKGGALENLYPFYEANDTLLFTPGEVTKGNVHVRDALDLKRMMITVVVALLPCVFMAIYNTGYQANYWISQGATPLHNWQEAVYFSMFGSYQPGFLANFAHGAIYFLPVFAMTFLVGGHIEVAFALARKHEINEGFLVTGFLLPLTLPPTIPLWQVAMGVAFGVIIGKEVFGGTGMNVLNVALTARAFLFFAYPADISGDSPWIAADLSTMADGSSGATMLAQAAAATSDMFVHSTHALGGDKWMDSFLGFIPGSMGETSTLACLIGAAVLIVTQIGSWRTMLGVIVGTALMAYGLNLIGSETNFMFSMPFYWHFVVGGWAFGMVFMATDPVTSAFTDGGKLIYGFLIGVMVVLVRVVNPAYPEGMMLAILFMNMFAPFIDHFFVQANIKRRLARHGA
jgi:Na+-transporting NADH:ubiquinone oxidoreductase subunit B